MDKYHNDDILLVEDCIKRDLLAWSAFISKYSGLIAISAENSLKRYGVRLRRQDTEDIRQDVLASIWKGRKLEEIRNRKDISYWVAMVSQNAAIGYSRKLSREPKRPVSIFENTDREELLEFIPSGAGSPKDEALRNELSKQVDDAIESLPAKEKLIMKLNIIYGKKYGEISKMLGLPKGTVSSCIKRAKEKLKKKLQQFRRF